MTLEVMTFGVPKTHREVVMAGHVNAVVVQPAEGDTPELNLSETLRQRLIAQAENIVATFGSPDESLVPGLIGMRFSMLTTMDANGESQLRGEGTANLVFLKELEEGEEVSYEEAQATPAVMLVQQAAQMAEMQAQVQAGAATPDEPGGLYL